MKYVLKKIHRRHKCIIKHVLLNYKDIYFLIQISHTLKFAAVPLSEGCYIYIKVHLN